MKKVLSLLLTLSLLICCLPLTAFGYNEDNDQLNKQVREVILSVEEAITEVTETTGVGMYIPEGKEFQIYEYFKNYSRNEIRDYFLKEIQDYRLTPDVKRPTGEYQAYNASVNQPVEPKANVEHITQVQLIAYGTYFYMYATVIGGGTPITYKYQSIDGCSTWYNPSQTGLHFVLSHWSYTISSDRKACLATVYGSAADASGVGFTNIEYYNLIFTAN